MVERLSTGLPRLAACCAAMVTSLALPALALPSFEEVRAAHRPSDTLVLDRHGEELQRLRTDASARRGQWLTLADISPAMREALVYSEDKNFYAHSGVDWRAVSAAAWGNLWNQRTRGASTLTMQLAGLLDADWRAPAGGRSVAQKIGQSVAAQVLERRWRKDQILEAYLNLVPFRGELVGIEALSQTLFGKAAHGLDAREAAVATALLRAPNAKPAQVVARACGIEKNLAHASLDTASRVSAAASAIATATATVPASCDGLDLFASAALQRRALDAMAGPAPHFARRLVVQAREAGVMGTARPPEGARTAARAGEGTPVSARLTSSLDAPLQRFARASLQQQLRELGGRNIEDGAVLVLDNASGEVLAWVGSSEALSQAGEVDAVSALRQPGSTLKPFLYAQAIAERRLTAASLLEDAPTHIPTAGGLYVPQNYDHQFKGWVSVRTALAASLNVPAVRTLVLVDPDRFAHQLRALGLPLKQGGDYYGYSLALGSAEVSLLNLSNAYRTLANGGLAGPVRLQHARGTATAALVKGAPVLDPRAAYIVGDILSDAQARAPTFGTDSVLATRFWSAVKTGTSKDMRDNWAVGYSRRYTVGVWVGNASGAAMHGVSGTSGAAPVWAAVMGYLHRDAAPVDRRAPSAPAGLVREQVRFGNSLEAARAEWFLPGTAQTLFATDCVDCATPGRVRASGGSLALARITAPDRGTLLALDPDIPPANQRLQLSAGPVAAADATLLRWRVDGKPLASGASAQWLPWPGRHRLTLSTASGEQLDEVRVEVRGAGVKTAAQRMPSAPQRIP